MREDRDLTVVDSCSRWKKETVSVHTEAAERNNGIGADFDADVDVVVVVCCWQSCRERVCSVRGRRAESEARRQTHIPTSSTGFSFNSWFVFSSTVKEACYGCLLWLEV